MQKNLAKYQIMKKIFKKIINNKSIKIILRNI